MGDKKLPADLFRKAAKGMRPMEINGKPADWDEQAAKADALLAALGLTLPK